MRNFLFGERGIFRKEAKAPGTIVDDISILEKKERLTETEHHYFHSNDVLVDQALKKVHEVQAKEGETRVAIIVGTGALWSILSSIPAELILLCDMDPEMVKWLEISRSCLQNASSIEEYKSLFFSAAVEKLPAPVKTSDFLEILKDDLEIEIRSLGNKHFLSSEKNFIEAQVASRQKQCVPILINLTSDTQMDNFAEVLNKHKSNITFANLTNLYEYRPEEKHRQNLRKNLSKLPFHEKSQILFSSKNYNLHKQSLIFDGVSYRHPNLPVAVYAEGIGQYFDSAEVHNNSR